MRLCDAKVVVTGAAGGMGRYFCLKLAEAGAKVCAGDIHAQKLASLEAEGTSLAGSIFARQLDVSDDSQTSAFVDWAFHQMGGLNTLINNAGILRDALLVKQDRETGKATPLSKETWQQVIDINLTGATWMVRDVVTKMINENQGPGLIVNMSSIARGGNRGQSNYVAAKAALAANTVTWAREFARFGIRVGAIAPGMIETPMTANMNPKAREALVKSVPLGRIGNPDDIWQAVQFMFACDYFTARTIEVDGGLAM